MTTLDLQQAGRLSGGPAALLARCKAAWATGDRLLGAAAARAPFGLPWTLGALLATAGYVWVFSVTTEMTATRTLITSLMNVAAAYGLGFGVREVLSRWVLGRSPLMQLVSHGGLAVGYSLLWYVLTVTLLGWRDGSLLKGAVVPSFSGVAFVWQIFQGLALYATAAALTQLSMRRVDPAATAPGATVEPASHPQPKPQVLLLRNGDEIRAVELDDIVLIAAADDYSEVVTATGRHLSRRSLGEFEAELPPTFLRVHRSTLVNLDRLLRAEPAGAGRMTLHLTGGLSATASRTGARLLRERAA